ncbi:Dihydroflavonol-4-reductase [Wickerhamomyces ciferrii]|uniref:Dihydroflavonol-4-reductase n=1 Tax=Wickerhamomyces ciferrii (strain ATCC 14091 / BCRC 22168 / CBS 111 / JCM 3599 / NBRC 0793 / NRRL Y-1031 F-60-10) TaxID=1206466 RepID=K0KXD5_WICCF|nr:Dihydroflavonol-4-reductase [Wickerhamomyces ciferrii]CCH46697.1 Dihydroflavonol-4-reductase [Wickerhamomyces ciferrii]
MAQTVLITGATGFIATYVIKLLLEQDYIVIGTVRTMEKGDNFVKNFQNDNFSYVIVPDLTDSKQHFEQILQSHPEIEIVLHTASPVFPRYYKDAEQDLILPAINGTKNLLESVTKYGLNVKRLVYTSSDSAIHSVNREGQNLVENEDSWNDVEWVRGNSKDIDAVTGYDVSKTYTEREVWEYSSKNPNVKVSVINPAYVFGPQLFDETVHELNYSSDLLGSLVTNGNGDDYKRLKGGFIDVRDVAKAHLFAFQRDNTINKRLFLNETTFTEQTLLDIVNAKFPSLHDKVPKGVPGSDKETLRESFTVFDNTKTKEILDFEFISLEQGVFDTIDQIIKVKGI